MLALPPDGARLLTQNTMSAVDAWAGYLGGPVVLTRSIAEARSWLLQAFGLGGEQRCELLPSASGDLVDQMRDHSFDVSFLRLDDRLRVRQKPGTIAWLDVLSGLHPGSLHRAVLEHHSSLPEAGALGRLPRGCVAAIWDLALTADAETSGAIVGLAPAFAGETSVRDLSFERRWTPPAFSELALCQLERWRELSTVQRSVLERTWTGLREAAGLVVPVGAALFAGCSLSGAVPVQVPEEIDPATFYAYVLREGTPVSWLTLARPVHFGVVRVSGAVAARQAAERLARWMLIPAGPRDTQTDIEQAVLGVVKAAEYLGVRWRTEPARAAAYATLLDEWYGSGHDAFRPIFPTETQSGVADFSW